MFISRVPIGSMSCPNGLALCRKELKQGDARILNLAGMKTLQRTQDTESPTQVSHDSHSDQQNNHSVDAPQADSGSISASSVDNRKVSRHDIELVQNLIERCLQLYMNRDEVVKTLLTRARIDTGFTKLVWKKLEEENADFFRAYYIRLKLKKQIILFNHLLEHQCQVMNYQGPPMVPLAPIQNGIHPMAVNNMPMGYPVLQQPILSAPGQPHIDTMGRGISSCHVVNGVPAPSNFHPIRMNSGNEMTMDANVPVMPSISEMSVSPKSAASNGHFPFTASDMPEMGVETSVLDTTFTLDVSNSVGLHLGPDVGVGDSRDSLASLDQIPWGFSISDLDIGTLGNYPGSPFLHSDSDILLNSPEQDDNHDIVEEYFADSVPSTPCSQSDEEKS